MENSLLFFSLLALVAFLYASVGHGGASGYLAVMALIGITPALMKPSALLMNLAVSFFAFAGFYKAGHFRWRLFWPFALASIPAAFVGGLLTLPDALYKQILAACILISVLRMLYKPAVEAELRTLSLPIALVSGAAIGLLSGMIGIGGGIILSPLILVLRWGTVKETAASSALFIFVNSVAGLIGMLQRGSIELPSYIQFGLLATILSGLLGAYLGSHRFNLPTLRYLLALCLIIASLKLVFTT